MNNRGRRDYIINMVSKRFDDECWQWSWANFKEYGIITYLGKNIKVHRFAYELRYGQLTSGLELDHICRNTSCFNPQHLEQVTHQENMIRSIPYRIYEIKEECPQGHLYSGYNLYISPSGQRVCRECKKLHQRRYRSNLKREIGDS